MNSYSSLEVSGSAGPEESGHDFITALWNSKRHGLIMLCAALWVVFPFDLDFIPVLGWFDDGFAIVLGFKHLLDLFRGDVSTAHAAMQEQPQPRQWQPQPTPPSESRVIDGECVVVNSWYSPN